MAQCPVCNGAKHIRTGVGVKPCPKCGGQGVVQGGGCNTCKHKGSKLDQVLNVSLLAPNEIYCKYFNKRMSPDGCQQWEE